MTVFPLDALRNAVSDHALETAIEAVRTEAKAFDFQSASGFTTEEALEVFDVSRPRMNALLSILKTGGCDKGIDIGTGFGFLPVIAHRIGISMAATERQPEVAAFAGRHGIEVIEYVIGQHDPPVPEGNLDFAVASEVLEHIRQHPSDVLTEIAQLIRHGGLLVVSTPNIARASNLDLLIRGESILEPLPRSKPGEDAFSELVHVREYSLRELVEALEDAQLEVQELRAVPWGGPTSEQPLNPFVADTFIAYATK